MNIIPTVIPGCFEVHPRVMADLRGRFVKTFHCKVFQQFGLSTDFMEEYYSVSCRHVLRGLHFQIPPFDQCKLVYCVEGEVLDAIVDLRKGSPTFGQHALFQLKASQANMLFMASGIAHGFYVTSSQAIMMYKVTTVYSANHDLGILWNSANIPWPDVAPVLSSRDQQFPSFTEFHSPFVFQ